MATITKVRSGKANTGGGNSLTFTSAGLPVTGTLVVAGLTSGAALAAAVTDNHSNTFVKFLERTAASGMYVAAYYKVLPGDTATSYEVTADLTDGDYATLFVSEWTLDSGTWGSHVLTWGQGNGGPTTTATSGSVTTTAGAMLVSVIMNDHGSGATFSAGPGFAQVDIQTDGLTYGAGQVASNPTSGGASVSAGSHSCTWTQQSQSYRAAIGAIYINAGVTAYSVGPATGSYGLTGAGLTLKTDRKVYPAAGSLALTGAGVGLRTDRVLQAASASFVIAGSVGFKADRVLSPASGDFALAGTAEFTYTPAAGAYVLDAASASFVISSAARLAVDRYLDLASATFTLTGGGVDLRSARVLDAAAANYDAIGSGVTLTAPIHYTIACASAEFLVAANDAGFAYSGEVVATTRPTGGPPGKRIRFRGRYYDSVKDRQYLSRALQEFVEERIEPPPEPKSRKQRKRSKTTAKVSNFTPAEIAEIEPVIAVVQEREQKLAEYVADLLMMMEEEEFLLMAA